MERGEMKAKLIKIVKTLSYLTVMQFINFEVVKS